MHQSVINKFIPSQEDEEIFVRLAMMLPSEERWELVQNLVDRIILKTINSSLPSETYEEKLDLVEDLKKKLCSGLTSVAHAQYLIDLARSNDPDVDSYLFPEGCAIALLTSADDLRLLGEQLLINYLEYRINTSSEFLPHPSDYSKPSLDNEDDEWDRLVNDFTWMARDWRNQFFQNLLVQFSERQ